MRGNQESSGVFSLVDGLALISARLMLTAFALKFALANHDSPPFICITLVGAGLAGLAFAIHLATVLESLAKSGQPIRRLVIDVYDGRLCERESGVIDWLGPHDDPPNTRRQQCVPSRVRGLKCVDQRCKDHHGAGRCGAFV
jgi:hypothetical protein